MCVCIYTHAQHMYIYIYVCVCLYVYVCIYIKHIYKYIYIHEYICMYGVGAHRAKPARTTQGSNSKGLYEICRLEVRPLWKFPKIRGPNMVYNI